MADQSTSSGSDWTKYLSGLSGGSGGSGGGGGTSATSRATSKIDYGETVKNSSWLIGVVIGSVCLAAVLIAAVLAGGRE